MRFKVEASEDAAFQSSVIIVDRSVEDITPELSLKLIFAEVKARYVRLTSLKLLGDRFMGCAHQSC